MDIDIRTATPADYSEVGRIAVAAYRADGQLVKAGGYEARLRDAASRAHDAELIVAVSAGAVVGSVTCCGPESSMAEVAGPGELEFRMLAVDPSAQGRGIGEALVRACLDRARERGAHAVVICTRDDVALSAQRLYRRLGFVRDAERDWTPIPGVGLIGWRLTV